MQRHRGHYGGILHNEPREIQISRISVWAVMLSGEILAELLRALVINLRHARHHPLLSLALHRNQNSAFADNCTSGDLVLTFMGETILQISYKSSFRLKVGNSHSLDSVLGMENGG